MLARVLAVIVCLCLCLCVSVGPRKLRHVIAQGVYSFLTPTVVGGRPPFPMKFALKVTHPLSNTTISTNTRS